LASAWTIIYLALSMQHNPKEVEHFLGLAASEGFEVEKLWQEVPCKWRVTDVCVVRMRLMHCDPPL
jgi:hypothetical protein